MSLGSRLTPFLLSGALALQTVSAALGADIMALKSGETVELGTVYWVVNCRSMLKGPITAEVLEGPPGLSVSIRDQKVIPRTSNCAKQVPGGMLLLTAAKDVKARAEGKLTIRMKYPTLDGERQKSREMDVVLLP